MTAVTRRVYPAMLPTTAAAVEPITVPAATVCAGDTPIKHGNELRLVHEEVTTVVPTASPAPVMLMPDTSAPYDTDVAVRIDPEIPPMRLAAPVPPRQYNPELHGEHELTLARAAVEQNWPAGHEQGVGHTDASGQNEPTGQGICAVLAVDVDGQ